MRQYDEFIGGEFVWFTGVVEDIVDSENLGRVKVRCFGFHTEDKGILSTDNLPWATVMGPTTSAGVQGIGSNHRLMSGSWVVGFFRDGPSAQDPLILGSIASQTEKLPDPASGFTGSYPTQAGLDMPSPARNEAHNKHVYVSPANNTIEINDTDGAEDIIVTHHTGTYFRLHPDGTVEINSSNNTVNIVGNTSVTGTLRVSETTHSVGDVSTDAGNAPTLATHVHEEVPGTGGASSPTPASTMTSEPYGGGSTVTYDEETGEKTIT